MQTDDHKKSFEKEIEEQSYESSERTDKPKRKSSLGGQLNYKEVRVTFPAVKETTLGNYMVYKVHYVYDSVEYSIDRRYSDFVTLRTTLRQLLPCHFIFPAHRKQAIVS